MFDLPLFENNSTKNRTHLNANAVAKKLLAAIADGIEKLANIFSRDVKSRGDKQPEH